MKIYKPNQQDQCDIFMTIKPTTQNLTQLYKNIKEEGKKTEERITQLTKLHKNTIEKIEEIKKTAEKQQTAYDKIISELKEQRKKNEELENKIEEKVKKVEELLATVENFYLLNEERKKVEMELNKINQYNKDTLEHINTQMINSLRKLNSEYSGVKEEIDSVRRYINTIFCETSRSFETLKGELEEKYKEANDRVDKCSKEFQKSFEEAFKGLKEVTQFYDNFSNEIGKISQLNSTFSDITTRMEELEKKINEELREIKLDTLTTTVTLPKVIFEKKNKIQNNVEKVEKKDIFLHNVKSFLLGVSFSIGIALTSITINNLPKINYFISNQLSSVKASTTKVTTKVLSKLNDIIKIPSNYYNKNQILQKIYPLQPTYQLQENSSKKIEVKEKEVKEKKEKGKSKTTSSKTTSNKNIINENITNEESKVKTTSAVVLSTHPINVIKEPQKKEKEIEEHIEENKVKRTKIDKKILNPATSTDNSLYDIYEKYYVKFLKYKKDENAAMILQIMEKYKNNKNAVEGILKAIRKWEGRWKEEGWNEEYTEFKLGVIRFSLEVRGYSI